MRIPAFFQISHGIRNSLQRNSEVIFNLLLISTAAFCVLVQIEVTRRHGIGLGNDSVVYIAGARNWLRGNGLSWISSGGEVKPITMFPPLFSLLLAGLRVCNVDFVEGARFINIFAYGINVGLVGLFFYRISNIEILSLLGAFLFACSPGIVYLHSWGMTDGLYLTLSLVAIYFSILYVREGRILWLIASALSVSLACLLRYVGVSLYITLVVVLSLEMLRKKSREIRNLAIFTAISLAPIGYIFYRNYLLTSAVNTYRFSAEVRNIKLLEDTIVTMSDWFLPGSIVEVFRSHVALLGILFFISLLVLLGGAIVLMWRISDIDRKANFPNHYWAIGMLYFCVYFGVIYLSITRTLSPPNMGERILAPAYLSLLLIFFGFATFFWNKRSWVLHIGLVLVIILFIRQKFAWAKGYLTQARFNGLGYASLAWKSSETIQALREMDTDIIYTDNVAAVYILADRRAYNIPLEFKIQTAEIDFTGETPQEFRMRMESEDAVLVLVGGISGMPGGYGNDDISEGLTQIAKYNDGLIYAHPSHVLIQP